MNEISPVAAAQFRNERHTQRETKGAGSFTDKQGCSKFSAQELLHVAIFGREFYEYKYSRALQHFLNGIEEPCLEFVF